MNSWAATLAASEQWQCSSSSVAVAASVSKIWLEIRAQGSAGIWVQRCCLHQVHLPRPAGLPGHLCLLAEAPSWKGGHRHHLCGPTGGAVSLPALAQALQLRFSVTGASLPPLWAKNLPHIDTFPGYDVNVALGTFSLKIPFYVAAWPYAIWPLWQKMPLLTQEKPSGRLNSLLALPAILRLCHAAAIIYGYNYTTRASDSVPAASLAASQRLLNEFFQVCMLATQTHTLKLLFKSLLLMVLISETILGIYWIHLDSCLSSDSNSNSICLSVWVYLSESSIVQIYMMIGPMALWHYGIPIEPSIHESIESIHLDLLLNLTYDLDQCLMSLMSYVLCPMSDHLGPGLDLGTAFSFAPSTRLDCGHSFSTDAIQHGSAAHQGKLNTPRPTVGVFPGGLACLAARRCGTQLDRSGPVRMHSKQRHCTGDMSQRLSSLV